MNKLSYGLLSLLSTEPMTGYDLTIKINKFWRSTHSAIYPLLSELEEKGLVELNLIEQSGKPDKKIYNLTVEGRTELYHWFTSETADEAVRDEMTLKLYCIKCMDTESAEKLLNEFEAKYKRKIEQYNNAEEKFKCRFQENSEAANTRLFGAYILSQKALYEAKLNLRWCEWVKELNSNQDINFIEKKFNPERNLK